MCLEMLHSLNLSNSVMHFATRPPSLLSIMCLNTPPLPKHRVFKECHTLPLRLNHCNVLESAGYLSLCVICLTTLASSTPLTPNVFEHSQNRRITYTHMDTCTEQHTYIGMIFFFLFALSTQPIKLDAEKITNS